MKSRLPSRSSNSLILLADWSRPMRSTVTRAWLKPSSKAAATTCSRSRETADIGLPAPIGIWPRLPLPSRSETETSHGRSEWRQAEVVAAAEPLMPGHKAFIRITSRRDQAKPLTRLFMASTLLSPQQAIDLTRAHWQIENGTALDARCSSGRGPQPCPQGQRPCQHRAPQPPRQEHPPDSPMQTKSPSAIASRNALGMTTISSTL